jgi:hypothetical protein
MAAIPVRDPYGVIPSQACEHQEYDQMMIKAEKNTW